MKIMMKSLNTMFFLCLMLGTVNSSLAQKKSKNNDLKSIGIYGNVSTYTISTYGSGNTATLSEDSLREKFSIRFNEAGNITETKNWHPNGVLRMYTKRDFDNNGRLKTLTTFDSAHNTLSIQSYLYDRKGRMIQENRKAADNSPSGKVILDYDKKGNVIEENIFDKDNQTYKIKYRYYQGRLKDKTVYYWDTTDKYFKIEDIFTYGYDLGGNLVSLKTRNDSYTYTYKFDKSGNWVRKIELKNNEPSIVMVRELEYR